MCLRPGSLTLALAARSVYHYSSYSQKPKILDLRTNSGICFNQMINKRNETFTSLYLYMFTSGCLIIVQDAGSGCDWVWLETVFWLELDNAWSSLPPPEQLCSAWLTSLHLLEFCQPFFCFYRQFYLQLLNICPPYITSQKLRKRYHSIDHRSAILFVPMCI